MKERTQDKLEQIAALAEAHKMARLTYRRPGEAADADYVVEPYRLQRTASGLAVHCWQVSPPPEGRDGWRDFRLDRVAVVADAGRTFTPRAPVHFARPAAAHAGGHAPHEAFHGWGDQKIEAMSAADDYFRYVEDAMLDAKVTPEEMELARSLGDRVEPHERKAVHARVFANVLNEVVQDSRISHREELYLRSVRDFLEQLGWAP